MKAKDLKAWLATVPDEAIIEESSTGAWYDDLKYVRARVPEVILNMPSTVIVNEVA